MNAVMYCKIPRVLPWESCDSHPSGSFYIYMLNQGYSGVLFALAVFVNNKTLVIPLALVELLIISNCTTTRRGCNCARQRWIYSLRLTPTICLLHHGFKTKCRLPMWEAFDGQHQTGRDRQWPNTCYPVSFGTKWACLASFHFGHSGFYNNLSQSSQGFRFQIVGFRKHWSTIHQRWIWDSLPAQCRLLKKPWSQCVKSVAIYKQKGMGQNLVFYLDCARWAILTARWAIMTARLSDMHGRIFCTCRIPALTPGEKRRCRYIAVCSSVLQSTCTIDSYLHLVT